MPGRPEYNPRMNKLKVRVVAYKGKLIIIPDKPNEDVENGWYPTGGDRLGCVLEDSTRLGVSFAALEIMRLIRLNRDAVGDIDWWRCDDGKYAFSWWGPVFRIIDPERDEAARGFRPYEKECSIIPNEVPEEAKHMLSRQPMSVWWKEPLEIA